MALADNLELYLKCDEASGTRADSFSTHDALENNGVGSAAGIINAGATFNGSNQYLNIPSFSLAGPDISVSMWVYFDATTDAQLIGKGPVNTNWQLYFESGFFKIRGNDSFDTTVSVSGASAGAWIHLVAVWSGTVGKIYINGSLDVTGVVTPIGNATINGTNDVFLGTFLAFYYLNGRLDEIALFSRTLDGSDVTALYNGGEGLAYPLDGGGSSFTGASEFSFISNGIAKQDMTFAGASDIAIAANGIGASVARGVGQASVKFNAAAIGKADAKGAAAAVFAFTADSDTSPPAGLNGDLTLIEAEMLIASRYTRLQIGKLLVMDPTTFGGTVTVHLVKAPFLADEDLVLDDVVDATFDGSAPISSAVSTQYLGKETSLDVQVITIVPPALGWRYFCASVQEPAEWIYGYYVKSANGNLLGAETFDRAVRIANVGDSVAIEIIQLRIAANPFFD